MGRRRRLGVLVYEFRILRSRNLVLGQMGEFRLNIHVAMSAAD
jgi:hypothetical protein